MKRLDAKEFDALRDKCSTATQDVLDFLRTAAQHAGAELEEPSFEVRGVGITYWSRGKRFCRFDPKPQAGHVWALVPGAARASLEGAGIVSKREDGPRGTIKNMRGAVRLVPAILEAYDQAERDS